MKSEEIYEEISSGAWIRALVNRMGYAFTEESEMDNFARRASIHFQELFETYTRALVQEEAEEALEVQRVTEAINQDSSLVPSYKEQGWKITRRTLKEVDTEGFIEGHRDSIPQDALAVVKTRLPPELKKEFAKYEAFKGYSYTVKRSEK